MMTSTPQQISKTFTDLDADRAAFSKMCQEVLKDGQQVTLERGSKGCPSLEGTWTVVDLAGDKFMSKPTPTKKDPEMMKFKCPGDFWMVESYFLEAI